MKAYCVKCKVSREMKEPKEKKTANGRLMMQGICPHCGTKMNVFIASKKGGDNDNKKDDKKGNSE